MIHYMDTVDMITAKLAQGPIRREALHPAAICRIDAMVSMGIVRYVSGVGYILA